MPKSKDPVQDLAVGALERKVVRRRARVAAYYVFTSTADFFDQSWLGIIVVPLLMFFSPDRDRHAQVVVRRRSTRRVVYRSFPAKDFEELESLLSRVEDDLVELTEDEFLARYREYALHERDGLPAATASGPRRPGFRQAAKRVLHRWKKGASGESPASEQEPAAEVSAVESEAAKAQSSALF